MNAKHCEGRSQGSDLRLEQEMKPSRTQLLLLIACLLLLAVPVLAQTSATPAEAEVGGKLDTPLPDAPNPNPEPRRAPPSAVRPMPGGTQVPMDKEFLMATGILFGSSIANVELTHRCLENDACTLVPRALVRRRALYGVGLPADAGVTVLGYFLKRSGRRWWFVPAAIVTAGNTIYGIHAAQHMR